MDSENRFPPQDENAFENVDTEFFPTPQSPLQYSSVPQQQPFSPRQPRKKRSTKIGLGYRVTFLALLLFTIILAACDSTTSNQAPASAPTPTHTSVPQPSATKVPSGLAGTHGTPQIGSLVSDFIGKYGQPYNHSNPSSKHWMRASNSNADRLVVSAADGVHVELVVLSAINNEVWTRSQAQDLCMVYTPPDAEKVNQVQLSTNDGYDVIYRCASLATKFSADNFTDANGNAAKPGTFDVRYLIKSDGSIDSCSIQIGSQQAN